MRLAPLILLPVLAGCLPLPDEDFEPDLPPEPAYSGIETRLLEGDLVSFVVTMTNPRGAEDLEDYAACAAARYTLIRGYGFARHVRTLVEESSGIWRADAVYTISPDLPQGLRTIDAAVTAAECAQRGIPSV